MRAKENGAKMARKTFALALVIVLVISMSLAYVLPSSLLNPSQKNGSSANSSQYAGYSQIQVYENSGSAIKIGNFNYVFVYYPATTNNGTAVQGYVAAFIQGASTAPTDFTLATNILRGYYGVTFAITYVGSNYIILMVKAN
jgi:hypothetical protein